MVLASRQITLLSSADQAPSQGGPTALQDLEASWEAQLRPGRGSKALIVTMQSRNIDDQRMALWCRWFEREHPTATISIMCFSCNELTSIGVAQLLTMLRQRQIKLTVLKLFKNRIQQATDLVGYLRWCGGSLRELHLSHNLLSTDAAVELITCTASMRDPSGGFCYPGEASQPLWLRLENNNVQGQRLDQAVSLPGLRRSKAHVFTIIDGNQYCNPKSCSCAVTPAIHLTYIFNQRSAANARQDNVPARVPEPAVIARVAKAPVTASRPAAAGSAAAGSASASASAWARPLQTLQAGGLGDARASAAPVDKEVELLSLSSRPCGVARSSSSWASTPSVQSRSASKESVAVTQPLGLERAQSSEQSIVKDAWDDDVEDIAPGTGPAATLSSAAVHRDASGTDLPPLCAASDASKSGAEPGQEPKGPSEVAEVTADVSKVTEVAATCSQRTAANLARRPKVAATNYVAEAQGYLSVKEGDVIKVLSDESPGDDFCTFASYTFCELVSAASAFRGWTPTEVLWDLYVDRGGKFWSQSPRTLDFRYEHLLR